MKTLTVLLLFMCSHLFSQWSADTRLTNNTSISYTSYNNAKCIASAGPIVFAVWYDNRDGNYEIYFKRSTDAGLSWSADVRLTNETSLSEFPAIEISSGAIHVFWRDLRDGNGEIYYKRSTSGGVMWSADIRLTNNSANSEFPSAVSDGNNVMVMWADFRDGNKEIYLKRSTDAGASWGSEVRITNNSAISDYPSASISGANVHLVWREFRDGPPQIYYKSSSDAGATWGTDTRVVNSASNAEYPNVSAAGSIINVTWTDDRNADSEIYYKRSTDAGLSWGSDLRLTSGAGNSEFSSIIASGVYVHIVWQDARDGNLEIYYKQSTTAGATWEADVRLTDNTFSSSNPSIHLSGQALHLIWNDGRDGNYEIYYKRNPTGNPVGVSIIAAEIATYYSLEQNYPNPFNPVTNIKFSVPKTGIVKLTVFDAAGRETATLFNGELSAGTYNYDFDASHLASGIYFYKLESGDFTQTKKMVLVK